jgi:hypothetical protein
MVVTEDLLKTSIQSAGVGDTCGNGDSFLFFCIVSSASDEFTVLAFVAAQLRMPT